MQIRIDNEAKEDYHPVTDFLQTQTHEKPRARFVPDVCDENLKFPWARKWLKRQNLLLIMIANVYL